ncbi:MAG TPA: hypothetical protein VK470_00440 [Bacteroidota bacterium]|nr:hypothetical protein [Bacteroidota bacterium]
MNNLRILYHMMRADFLERTRRYSFLVMLALVMWIGYLSASGQFRMRVPPDHIGIVNSAWVGATMTITVTLLLGWLGFYLVKGSVSRDYETGVGQIMATTPLSRRLYMLGKWLSNFAVLAIMILIMMLEGILMNLTVGVEGMDLLALSAPLLFIALPCMAVVAAVAVLFESVSWLRGGLGNVIYFFTFLAALISTDITAVGNPEKTNNPYVDVAGWRIIGESVSRAAHAAYPNSAGGFAFSITNLKSAKLFYWSGMIWTTDIFLSRLFFMLIAIGVVMLASLLFDRFNPSRVLPNKKRKQSSLRESALETESAPVSQVHLAPLTGTQRRFHFDALLIGELTLLLKGQRWWWYSVAIILIVVEVFSDVEITRLLLVLSWTWPILILSGLGCRESRHNTGQIVFSAPRPLVYQLSASWIAAFAVLAVIGSGALLRFLIAGEILSIMGWMTGVLFIPSLAVALGVLTRSNKSFEVLYVLWMYMLAQKAALFDFMRMLPESHWYFYALIAPALCLTAAFARQRQLMKG